MIPKAQEQLDHRQDQADSGLSDFRTNRRVLLLCALALPIGVFSAGVAKALLWLIAAVTNLAFFHRLSVEAISPSENLLGPWVITVPVIGAMLIGLMARYGSEKIRGHGIPEALEAILLGRSRIELKVAILKPLSSAISIGTGGPFGAEGPIIMTGGAFGSLFAQRFHLSAAERKTLLVAGAAAGMAAVFATPIAAVLLAVELLLFEWRPRSFIPVAVAAIVGSVVRVPLLGAGPIFPVVPHADTSIAALSTALIVGTWAGFVSGGLTLLVYFCEDRFQTVRLHWMWWPAIGALVVGIGGLVDPRVLGVGYETIHGLLRGEIVGGALLGLIVFKGIVWSISLGSGTSGGVLAPLLMIGGALGAWTGSWFPTADARLWAMVGMAAMMGGTMRSPLTGAVFVLELTHDLAALPAVFVGTIAALCVSVLTMRRSILTEKLARRGQHIAREYSVDVFELVRVGDVMDEDPPLLRDDVSIGEISAGIARGDPHLSRRYALLVVDAHDRLVGIVTRGDIVRALADDPTGTMRVGEACSRALVVTTPQTRLQDALALMLKHDIGRLPVVSESDRTRIVGYLGRSEILGARTRHHEEEEHLERGAGRTTVSSAH